MKQHQHLPNTQSAMRAKLKWDQREREFTTDVVETAASYGDRSFFAIQYTEGSGTSYSHITLKIPERYLVVGASLTIGAGENAEISAYFGSNSIGRSGWATGGKIDITEMDETSKAFAATFRFTIKHTFGTVEIVDGSLYLSLAENAKTKGFGQVQAKLDPIIFPSLGNLDARTIKYRELQDGRIQLTAIQQIDNDSQGILMLFDEQHARMFFLIGSLVYHLTGGRLQHEWNVENKTLTADFTDHVVSYQGNDHRITDGSINVTLA